MVSRGRTILQTEHRGWLQDPETALSILPRNRAGGGIHPKAKGWGLMPPPGVLVSVPPEGCGLPALLHAPCTDPALCTHTLSPHLCSALSLCPPTGRSVLMLLTHTDFLPPPTLPRSASLPSQLPNWKVHTTSCPLQWHTLSKQPQTHHAYSAQSSDPPSFQRVEEPDAICRAADLDDIFPGQLQQVCTCRSDTTGRAWSSARPPRQSPPPYNSPHTSGNEPRSSQAVLLCFKYRFPTICAR